MTKEYYVLYQGKTELSLISRTVDSSYYYKDTVFEFNEGNPVSVQTARREAHLHYMDLKSQQRPVAPLFDLTRINPDCEKAFARRCRYVARPRIRRLKEMCEALGEEVSEESGYHRAG